MNKQVNIKSPPSQLAKRKIIFLFHTKSGLLPPPVQLSYRAKPEVNDGFWH